MKLSSTIIISTILILIVTACGDQVRDDFPRAQFTSFFDLMDPRYSQDVFTATHDIDGNYAGVNGIIVFRVGEQFYAFDMMCPYEKKPTCSVEPDPDDYTIAECGCCGSRFLLADPYGVRVDGPANRGLKPYNSKVNGYQLVVSSY